MGNEKMREKYRGTLIGCALGDTIGMPIEIWSRERIRKYVGRVEEPLDPIEIIPKDAEGQPLKQDEFGKFFEFTRHFEKGAITDDTILTLAIAESIIDCQVINLDDIAKKHLEAFHKYKDKGGFGGTTVAAFRRLELGFPWYEAAISDGAGNGPAMKMSPIGLWTHATNNEQGLQAASMIGKITHKDIRSVTSGVIQAYLVDTLLRYEYLDKSNFFLSLGLASYMEEDVNQETGLALLKPDENLYSRIKWVIQNYDASSEDAYRLLGNGGFVNESYPFALFMFQKYWDDPIEGLLEAVNFGGDSDTVGAMYGALAGAKNGMIWPENWVNTLIEKDRIINAADGLYNLRRYP